MENRSARGPAIAEDRAPASRGEGQATSPGRRPLIPSKSPPRRATNRRGFVRPLLAILLLGGAGFFAWRVYNKPPPSKRTAGQTQRVTEAESHEREPQRGLLGWGRSHRWRRSPCRPRSTGNSRRSVSRKARSSRRATSSRRSTRGPIRRRWIRREGTLAHDQGLLAQAKSDLQRYETLGRQDSIAQQQVADQQFLVAAGSGHGG